MGADVNEETITKIKDAGIVGAGGGGFPTHVKVAASVDTVVVNGAECEPLLRVDQQLMDMKAAEMVKGLEIVMNISGAKKGIVALKGKYSNAISSLEKASKGKSIELYILDDFYPAGDEHVTLFEATGRLVPQGGIPLKTGSIVINVETLINIANALSGNPVTHTYVTITGAVLKPVTHRLPVGMTVKTALKIAGVEIEENMAVIDGGPMMGKLVKNLDDPVTKTTKGLIVLPREHQLVVRRSRPSEKIIKHAKAACIQCRYCTDLCPRYLLGHQLEPHKIMRSVQNFQAYEDILKMALVCSECGVCEQYACIAGLSPRRINALLKQEFLKKKVKANSPPKNQLINKMQEYRKIPVKRLISRLGLAEYDRPAPLSEGTNLNVEKVCIKLSQHIGKPCTPIVKTGQMVKQGELIGKIPEQSLGANIHASIHGKVTEVTDDYITITAIGGDE